MEVICLIWILAVANRSNFWRDAGSALFWKIPQLSLLVHFIWLDIFMVCFSCEISGLKGVLSVKCLWYRFGSLFTEDDHWKKVFSLKLPPQRQQGLFKVRKTHGKSHVTPHSRRRGSVFKLSVQVSKYFIPWPNDNAVQLQSGIPKLGKPFENIFEWITSHDSRSPVLLFPDYGYKRATHYLASISVDIFVSFRKPVWSLPFGASKTNRKLLPHQQK